MATQSASGHESPIMQFRDLWIYIQSASGLPERKLAKGTADDHSEMTEACLVSLGHNVPDDRRKELRCGHKALTWSIEFHIVERAGREVVLGSHDCEQVRAADDPGAFIVEASKKSKEEQQQHKQQKAKDKEREKKERAEEQAAKRAALSSQQEEKDKEREREQAAKRAARLSQQKK
ncbi:uncharacterized protein HMPREF1541_01342 [Cyphellophora europaea CBS 101466]|uniref:Uncharacterized protein n=1 Tax=Cyphellophora europaea (strain CBS 101466) TaxID=1220924 RepID=W2SEI9_CYPE1|nr:uncharacterized protein HMPREF1541_01342 [Cyphellophora europaea CBS 101466]ETN47151.1 hypothetical protein HMPREF1541_01342 [Cyphellophora europaea CBS 101466]